MRTVLWIAVAVVLALMITSGLCLWRLPAPPVKGTSLIFVRIPDSIMPRERSAKYGDPLDSELQRAGLGEVTGGGSQLSSPDDHGQRSIEWVGLDVEVTDLKRGVPFVKEQLIRLGAPAETILEFERAGANVEERIR